LTENLEPPAQLATESTPDDLSGDERPILLVLGDWVVDEYWFLRPSDARGASGTGYDHYESVSEPQHLVRDLCGAGHIAHILYQRLRTAPPTGAGPSVGDYRIIGLGSWHADDTEAIRHLIHAGQDVPCPIAQMRHSITSSPGDCSIQAPDDELTLYPTTLTGTTLRVVRLYQRSKRGEIEQISRVDLCRTAAPDDPSRLDEWDAPPPRLVTGIVVNDLGKGGITLSLVSYLRSKYPRARWYVRSKLERPPWLEQVYECLDFFLLGPELLASRNPLDTWIVEGRLTPQAIATLKQLPEHAPVAILTNRRELIARINDGGLTCMTAVSGVEPTTITQLRYTSAVFASIVRQHLAGTAVNDIVLSEALDEATGLSGIPDIDIPPFFRGVRKEGRPQHGGGSVASWYRSRLWNDEVREWNQGMTGLGLIQDERGEERLEVWRGSPVLPGYITVVDERATKVSKLGRLLKEFVRSGIHAKSSLSILLQADPGTGKTALARALATATGARILNFNVTSMLHREDLGGIFDAIAAQQASSDHPVLVFVDEVNARLEGQPVFDAFLSPLEARIYYRQGRAFQLRPCAWIFAGTRTAKDAYSSSEKYSDFMSRLTEVVEIDYASLLGRYAEPAEGVTPNVDRELTENRLRVEQQARLEHVYLAAKLILDGYPHVSAVSMEILEAMYSLNPGSRPAPSRLIARLVVNQLVEVHTRILTRENCPEWDQVYWSGDDRLVSLA
jgi:hypothetical protein